MDPYTGEIRNFGFNFAPYQWATCNGATLSLQQNSILYALIGTTFGGNGTTNFMLPNLAARAPCGVGQGPGLSDRVLGETFGARQVTLIQEEMAAHTHTLSVWQGGTGTRSAAPTAASALSGADFVSVYGNGLLDMPMSPFAITPSGGNSPHENRQPALALNQCIALVGVFPQFG